MEEIIDCAQKMRLNDQSDLECLRVIHSELKETEELFKNSKQTMQDDLNALESKSKRLNELVDEKSVFTPKEKEMELQVERAQQHKQDVDLELEKYKSDMQKCQDQLKKLFIDKDNICFKNSTRLEKIKYDIDLYTIITGIRWHYDCEPEEIKGYINKHALLKPFTLNTKTHSMFFISNYLWDLMEEN